VHAVAAVCPALPLQVRKLVLDMVLQTDMDVHFKLLKRFEDELAAAPDVSTWSSLEQRSLLFQMLVHLADLANPSRPWHLALTWAEWVVTEFLQQVRLGRDGCMRGTVRQSQTRPCLVLHADVWRCMARLCRCLQHQRLLLSSRSLLGSIYPYSAINFVCFLSSHMYCILTACCMSLCSSLLLQGRREASSGLAVSDMCNESKVCMPAAQLFFIERFMQPTLETFRPAAPSFYRLALPWLADTKAKWQAFKEGGVKLPHKDYPPLPPGSEAQLCAVLEGSSGCTCCGSYKQEQQQQQQHQLQQPGQLTQRQ
jgi:hypothetical protein